MIPAEWLEECPRQFSEFHLLGYPVVTSTQRHFSEARIDSAQDDCSASGSIIEQYKIAVATRQFEIQMFWSRSNYFLALNTALAAGFLASESKPFIAAAISFVACFMCCCWVAVNLGSKFWQIRWEEAAVEAEQKLPQGISLFSAPMEKMRADVQRHLARTKRGCVQSFVDGLVLRKPSVSFTATIMSAAFVAFWLFLLVWTIAEPARSFFP